MDVELTRISEFVQGLDDLVDIGNAVVYGVDKRGNSVKIEVSRLTDKTALETRVTALENGKANVVHTHTTSQVTDLQSFVQNAIVDKADKSELTPLQQGVSANTTAINNINGKIGEPNGLAELDTNGKVPSSQLPSFVDDVLEFDTLSEFPVNGESGKVYIAKDTNITYRWGGSSYVAIGSDLALGETASTAYRGDRGKTAYDHSQTQGNPHNTTIAQISGLQDALNGKQPTIGKNEYLKQVSDLDNYNAQNGEIVEFVGATTSNYVNGYVYKKVNYDKVFSVTDNPFGIPNGIYYNSGRAIRAKYSVSYYSLNGEEKYVGQRILSGLGKIEVGDYVVEINSPNIFQVTAVDDNDITLSNGDVVSSHSANVATADYPIYINDNNDEIVDTGNAFCYVTKTELRGECLVFLPINIYTGYVSKIYNYSFWQQTNVQPQKDTTTIESGIAELQTSKANTEDLKAVAFTGKSIDCYDLKIAVPDYKCCLIADIDDFYRSSSSTINLPFQGFVGRCLKVRGGGNIAEASAEVNCCVSYQNTDTEYHFTISSTHFDINPCIVLYNNKYYLCIDINIKKTANIIFLYGYFKNCLDTPLIVNSADCTVVRDWNYSIKNATTHSAGLMSAEDKLKVNTIGIIYRGQLQHNLSVMTSGSNLIHVHCQDFENENCCLDCYITAKGTTGSLSTFTWHYTFIKHDPSQLTIESNFNGTINVVNNTGRADSNFILFVDKLI